MNEFEKSVLEYCYRHRLILAGDRVLAALSGGSDSVALLLCLSRIRDILGFDLEAAHLNHSLRGQESNEDETFTRELCDRLEVHLTVSRLAEGELRKKGESIESAARNTRQIFLATIAGERCLSKIATGHTCDDQAETVLQRIIRGTGPAGLAGILPSRDDLWIRPLLERSRDDARAYLHEIGIGYREDSSNSDPAFFRNRIRHELLPNLKGRFSPNITGALTRLAELSRVQEDYLHLKMLESFAMCCIFACPGKILLDKQAFMSYHKVLQQRMVRHCLEVLEGGGRDTDMGEIERILDYLSFEQSRILEISSQVRLGTAKDKAVFVRISRRFDPLPLAMPGETQIPQDGCITVKEVSGYENVDGRNAVLVIPEMIGKYGPVTIGPVKRGEYMIPFGQKKPVKIYDIFSSDSIPRVLRESFPVVRAGAVPVWIPGVKSSECLRFQGKCEKVLHMSYHDGLLWS